MATHQMSVAAGMLPDTSGNVYFSPYDTTSGTANDFWKHAVAVFNDTSTDLYLYGVFVVPQNYVGSAAFRVHWNADNNVVTNKVKWGLSYRVLAADGSLDQATAQESVSNASGTTVSGTADGLNITAIGSPTAGNFVAGRLVEFRLERLGSDTTNDNMAARAVVHDLVFEWADA